MQWRFVLFKQQEVTQKFAQKTIEHKPIGGWRPSSVYASSFATHDKKHTKTNQISFALNATHADWSAVWWASDSIIYFVHHSDLFLSSRCRSLAYCCCIYGWCCRRRYDVLTSNNAAKKNDSSDSNGFKSICIIYVSSLSSYRIIVIIWHHQLRERESEWVRAGDWEAKKYMDFVVQLSFARLKYLAMCLWNGLF